MRLYQLILTLLFPVLLARLWLRDSAPDRAERLARGTSERSSGAVWVHGASNGELTSAKSLILQLSRHGPVLVTCNNPTGRALVQGWGFDGVTVQLAPLDLPRVLDRFIAQNAPRGLVVIENEIWPNRIDAMARRGLPVMVVSARLSQGSARNWARLSGLARHILGAIRLLSAQDAGSEDRFRSLGLSADAIAPRLNLKTTLLPDPPDAGDLAALSPVLARDKTVLAASTHPGEDEIILQGFKLALQQDPDLRLILAPRHPKRREAITRLLTEEGLTFAARSLIPRPAPDTQVYLADTLGEMGLWYSLAGTTFVGGSLVDHGGHTPFEPAAFGCAILHGPYYSNFSDTYDRLRTENASTLVQTPDEIAAALLRSPKTQAAIGEAAHDLLQDQNAAKTLDLLVDQITELCPNGQ
ncbi:3-deoxy-D-manno-octulosonic acid transferase [Actibacterium pelagium]|uniref:3-deoxy-D-manno-octulosonic acid transferase n=1 Tax=Actibacterium pelagium TaxID=2029103 RepID=A0A917AKN1_9RHOB|nr:3-deoxy-D-manno-octulosonic acid transferase [Actibacterium pelagium]GGE57758.1 3-deoxy-D-manno-octulosonic acid transferase [Actibacterium pelagium]